MTKIVSVLLLVFIALFPLARSVRAMSVVVNIPEKYSQIAVGDKLYFETEVKWPENTGRKDLRIEYSIRDQSNKEVAYLKVLKAIETQASFMDSITISENTSPGIYKINTKISDYGDLSQEVAASFTVIQGSIKSQTFIYIIIGLLFIIGILVVNAIYASRRRMESSMPGLMQA